MGVEEAKGGTRNRKDSEDVRGTLTAWRYNQQESCISFFIWQAGGGWCGEGGRGGAGRTNEVESEEAEVKR